MRSAGTTPRPSRTCFLWPGCEPAGEAASHDPFAGCVTRHLDALTARGAAEHHYRTMSLDDICGLPVPQLVAPRSHLHLWTTAAFLADAFTVIRAWGFAYKSCFVWVKPILGCGNYWRLAHEFLLLGVRGRTPFRVRTERSWQEWPRGRHSGKPERVRGIIERVSPGPYLELFGRRPVDGWVVFGDTIARGLFDLDIPELVTDQPTQPPTSNGEQSGGPP